MSNVILENSNAAYELLAHNDSSSRFFPVHSQKEMQNSSVTPNGHLWEQTLAKIKNDNFSQVLYHELSGSPFRHSLKHTQKHLALVHLLKSWREEDEEENEQEQRDTWEQLKQALDEDRLSSRKLFP